MHLIIKLNLLISLWLSSFSFRNQLFKHKLYFPVCLCVICCCSGVAAQCPLSRGSEVRGQPVPGRQWRQERTLCCRPSWVWSDSERRVTFRSGQYLSETEWRMLFCDQGRWRRRQTQTRPVQLQIRPCDQTAPEHQRRVAPVCSPRHLRWTRWPLCSDSAWDQMISGLLSLTRTKPLKTA